MKALERVMAVINDGVAAEDFIPLAPQVLGWAAAYKGIAISRYVSSSSVMAQCVIDSFREFGYDLVVVGADNSLEAEALGVRLAYPEHDYPYVQKYLEESELGRLKIPNARADGRLPQLLEAGSLVYKEVGQEVPVVAKLTGPMTMAAQLVGLEKLLYLSLDKPQRFKQLLDFCTEVCFAIAKTLVDTGVKGLMLLEPTASQAVVPADFFAAWLLPCLKQLFEEYVADEISIRWLHITGPVESILPYFQQLPVNLVSLDYENSFEKAMEQLPGVCFIGNIKPLLFVSGSRETIAAEARRLKLSAQGRLIISSGCELPLNADPVLVRELMQSRDGERHGLGT